MPTVSPGTLPIRAEHLRGLIDAHLARYPDAAVGEEDRARRCALELVRDAADELGDDVLERNQSLDVPALADHEHLVDASIAHVGQQLIGRQALVHA